MIRPRLYTFALLSAALTMSACGGSKPPPPGTSDPGGTGERITGSEQLGWSQAAANSGELATFGYLAYVDNTRNVLSGVSCSPAGNVFQCTSRLPPMSPGAHTIELASYSLETNAESGRSAPLRVTMAAATAGADPSSGAGTHEQTTADGIRLRADAVASALEQPTAIAFTRDGRALVGERRGRIYVMSGADLGSGTDRGSVEPALELTDIYLTSPSSGGLLDIALDPEFDQNHLAYVLYTTQHADGTPQFAIVRVREAGGRLGERAAIVGGIGASPDRPAGSIAFGRDGKLYAAFDDGSSNASGGDARAGRRESYSGKVLRLNGDGTTPDDQPSRSPVYAGDYRSPRGLDWHPVNGAMWIADATATQIEELRVKHSRVPLPSGTGASSIAFYHGDLLAQFQGNLLVAGGEARSLLRLRFDRRESTRLLGTERLFENAAGAISVVAVGPDGAIYLGSDRGLFRIGPG
jgi:glucose/arabinose dehydrogenase